MPIYIAFLRGINVGGHKKVPMAELRDLLTGAGFLKVQTYIQSGNVIFQSAAEASELKKTIQNLILNHFGFDVSVIVKTNKELQVILNDCPFSEEKEMESYFIILDTIPEANLVEGVAKVKYENEEVILKNDVLYFYSSTGYGRAKFNMNTCERKLKVVGTSRNYKTLVKLLSLSSDLN